MKWLFAVLLWYVASSHPSCSSDIENLLDENNKNSELCSTPNHHPGKCVGIKKCDSLYNLLKLRPIVEKNINYLKNSQCGFEDIEPKVCCAFNDEYNPSLPILPVPSAVQNDTPPGNVLPGLDVCGMFVDDRLIYGKGTQLGSFPWLALLEYQTPQGLGVHCGGVLISSRYILTAAHCVSQKSIPEEWKLIAVRLGEHDTKTDPDCIEVVCYTDCGTPIISVPIEEVVVHENYSASDRNQHHDIALLRISEPVTFSEFVSPTCLPPGHDEGLGMLPFAIAGWGSSKNFEGYEVKRDATLSIMTKSECQSAFPDLKITDNQLCGAPSSVSNDTCNGDSGGPLMNVNPQYSLLGNYFAVGVMSLAPKNCSSTEPTIYTKVRNYMAWMKRIMKA